MSAGFQVWDQHAMHYVTSTVVDWVDIFTRKLYRDIIIESLDFSIKARGLKLYSYVIMTNHLHMIVKSDPGKLSDTLGNFKKFTSRKIIDTIITGPESRREWLLHRFEWNAAQNARSSEHQLWTHENHPIEIHSLSFFNQKMNYIHENPVRAGWVIYPEDYLYSSARAIIKNETGMLPLTHWYD